MKNRILFINADREYGEGRNQNYLRPEDIEKIATVYEQKKEIPKYSRIVNIKEIEENDFNLNIRRYVDNSPEPEVEDVHAHLFGGIPKGEVEMYKEQFQKFNLSIDILLKNKNENYLEFKENIDTKSKIREIIESDESIKTTVSKHKEKLREWWNEVDSKIEEFSDNNNLWAFRNSTMKQLKEKFLSLGLLGEFKIAGIFVNWWKELRYDFKTIVSTGWSRNLIEDDNIKLKFFSLEMKEIEKLESKAAEIEGELNELLEEVEEWDKEEQGDKTVNKVKKYLKETIKDLKTSFSKSGLEESAKWKGLLSKIEKKEKELKKYKSLLKNAEKELEDKVIKKRKSLTEVEIKELLLEKFYETIDGQLDKYLNAEKKEIIKIFEKLWDKYKVPLSQIEKERQKEVVKLNEYLKKLGYTEAGH